MKLFWIILCLILLCGSCSNIQEKKASIRDWDSAPQVQFPPEMAEIWDGNSSLMPHADEPVCILWYEPIDGLWNSWYPAKVFSDTEQIRQIMDCLNYPENENHYLFKTEKYLLVIGVNRSLKTYRMVFVPFLLEKDSYVLLPAGRDRKLYTILTSAPEKENFYGSEDIDKAQILPRMERPNSRPIDSNVPSVPMTVF